MKYGLQGKYNPNTDTVSYAESRESTVLHELRHRAMEKSKEFLGGDTLSNKSSEKLSPKAKALFGDEESVVRMYDAMIHGDHEETLKYAGGLASNYIEAMKPTERKEFFGGKVVVGETNEFAGLLLTQAIADVINVQNGRERSYIQYPEYIYKMVKELTGESLGPSTSGKSKNGN